MQTIQNCAYRITEMLINSTELHIFKQLHWFPIEQHIKLKVVVLTYKFLNKIIDKN